MKIQTRLCARDIMRAQLITVSPSTELKEVARILSTHHISAVPVVGGEGRPVGVVSLSDLAAQAVRIGSATLSITFDEDEAPDPAFFDEGLRRVGLASDIMTTQVATVPVEASFKEVVETLADLEIHRVFVTDGKALVGVISSMDVVRAVQRLL